MRVLEAPDIEKLVKGANELLIKQEDIVQLIIVNNNYTLIYFG